MSSGAPQVSSDDEVVTSEWDSLSKLLEKLQSHLPMLGRFWLLLMLVFRIMILGTVANDLFEDEQEEFACNTLQPGCKQVCYDMAFPISQYRFWVFHIVLIGTPSLLLVMYVHHHNKKTRPSKDSQDSTQDCREVPHFKILYIVSVLFRVVAEVGFLVGQWKLYGFKVEAQFPCNHFPCPYTVDCFTSRPAEKTIFLCFYFIVGVISAVSSCAELFHSSVKWFSTRQDPSTSQSQVESDEKPEGALDCVASTGKQSSLRSSKKSSSVSSKSGNVNKNSLYV